MTAGVETTFELEIRPGTQSGAERVLRGRGVPGLRGGRGDLVVHVVVETPTRLDPRQEELLRELAAIRGEEEPTGQVRPASKSVFGRLRDAFNPRLMSLPVHLVPSLGDVAEGSVVTVDGRRGSPRRRRAPAAGGGVGGAHRRSRHVGAGRGVRRPASGCSR